MLIFVPWIIALWLRGPRHNAERQVASGRIEDAVRVNSAPPERRQHRLCAYDCATYVEQGTVNRDHDDRARRFMVAALHEFKRDFARCPVYRE